MQSSARKGQLTLAHSSPPSHRVPDLPRLASSPRSRTRGSHLSTCPPAGFYASKAAGRQGRKHHLEVVLFPVERTEGRQIVSVLICLQWLLRRLPEMSRPATSTTSVGGRHLDVAQIHRISSLPVLIRIIALQHALGDVSAFFHHELFERVH